VILVQSRGPTSSSFPWGGFLFS